MAEETPGTVTENNENTNDNTVVVPDVNVYSIDYSNVLNELSSDVDTISKKIEGAYSKLEEFYTNYKTDREELKKEKEEQKKKDKIEPQNYWDILRHQYFGMTLQAILTRTGIFTPEKLANIAADITDAAIKKMKNTPFTPIE